MMFFVLFFASPGTRRVGPSGHPDVGLDAHVADAHGSPPRHRAGAVREHGADPHGSLRRFRALCPAAGTTAVVAVLQGNDTSFFFQFD